MAQAKYGLSDIYGWKLCPLKVMRYASLLHCKDKISEKRIFFLCDLLPCDLVLVTDLFLPLWQGHIRIRTSIFSLRFNVACSFKLTEWSPQVPKRKRRNSAKTRNHTSKIKSKVQHFLCTTRSRTFPMFWHRNLSKVLFFSKTSLT